VKKLDIDALPSTPYDASGFRPFASAPEEVHFDFNTLPDSTFNLDKIPSEPLRFKTSALPPPLIVKAGALSPKGGTPLSVYDIGMLQGLRDNIALSLLKDNSGLIWIGTANGLYRYDGEYMRSYSVPGAGGLIEDKEGRIWFTETRGIGMLDAKRGRVSMSSAILIPRPNLPRMTLDDKGNIWISQIAGKGVDVIDPAAQTYQHLGRSTGISGTNVWGTFEDRQKNIWLTTDDGADIINPGKKTIKYLNGSSGLGGDTLMAVTGDQKGSIWIARKDDGVAAINTERGSIINYGSLQGLHNDYTNRLLYTRPGMLWVGANNGLSILDLQKGMVKIFAANEGISGSFIFDLLQDDKHREWVAAPTAGVSIVDQDARIVYPVGKKIISTLFEDGAGRIWAGSSSEGIVILNEDKKTATPLNKQNGFSDNFIQAFTEENGKLWVTSFGGLDIIDEAHKSMAHTGQKEGLVSDSIYSVLKDREGNIWFTGPSEGIEIIDSAQNSLRRTDKENGLSDNNILDIKQDNAGRIWIATYVAGVDVIDLKAGTVQYLNRAPGLKDTCYRNLMTDKYGRVWIGTDKGIYVADMERGTLTSIGTREGLSSDYVISLNEYGGSVIAAAHNMVNIIIPPVRGHGAGSKINPEKWEVSRMAGSEGLSQTNTTWDVNIVTRKAQYLWGDNGITIINDIKKEEDSAGTYIIGMNIMNEPQHFSNPFLLDEHDTLWTADSFYVKGQTPLYTGYQQQGKMYWDSISGPYNMPVNLHIPYNHNYIQFQFAQANTGRQDSVLYSYVLQGLDKNWSPVSNRTFTDNYLNLPSGVYTFKVRSKGLNGIWGSPAVFTFTISPPWYGTWWAYTIFALLGLGLLRLYIIYRSRKLKKENRVLEEKVAQRTRQLNESLEHLKSTQAQLVQSEKMASMGELTAGIAHEIQNPLNFVNNFSDVNTELIDEMRMEMAKGNSNEALSIAENIRENEQKINHHGKRADAIVKSMLQYSRNTTGQKDATDINALADEYLRLSYHGLRAKDKSFNASIQTDFDETVGKVNLISQDVGRVLLNLFNNAFYAVNKKNVDAKSGGLPYAPTVSVSTRREDGQISIRVRDNGNGVTKNVIDKIFQPFFTTKPAGEGTGLGLSLSYDIIKAHGGTLQVQTGEGEFTEFEIVLPA
jgi:signal transduction histidine kinase/ligand-binding sensor domain-containing protein